MKFPTKLAIITTTTLFIASSSFAAGFGNYKSRNHNNSIKNQTGFGIKAGTTGVGLEFSHRFNNTFGGRLSYNKYDYNLSEEIDDIDYEGELNLNSSSVHLDWYVMGGNFRLSLGGYLNSNEMNATGATSGDFYIGNTNYTIDNANIVAKADMGGFHPYLGLGWDMILANNFSLNIDLGILYQGSPEATLKANGIITHVNGLDIADVAASTFPNFESNRLLEEQALNEDMEDFELYPVLTMTVSYRF